VTSQARKGLKDCRLVLTLLEDETDLARWRIHWVAALALVRAVGHVLDKIDGRNAFIGPLAKAAHARWKSDVPEHEIFREFIERERNTILKEHEFNTHPNDEVELVLVRTLRRIPDGAIITDAQVASIGANIYRPLLSGWKILRWAREPSDDEHCQNPCSPDQSVTC
jgi:hypothetical protein